MEEELAMPQGLGRRKADSQAAVAERKAKAKTALAFVVSHPCRKGGGKDGAPGEWDCGGWGGAGEADSLTGMTDRKAKARTGLAFVVSHPCRKCGGKDGHPAAMRLPDEMTKTKIALCNV